MKVFYLVLYELKKRFQLFLSWRIGIGIASICFIYFAISVFNTVVPLFMTTTSTGGDQAIPTNNPAEPNEWGVYLASHDSMDAARAVAVQIRSVARLPRQTPLHVVRKSSNDRFLALMHGLDRDSAVSACEAARSFSQFCLVVPPEKLVEFQIR